MKKNFIVALAILAFVGCDNKSDKRNEPIDNQSEKTVSEETSATPAITSNVAPLTISGDVAYVDVMYVVAESNIAKTEGVALRDKMAKAEKKFADKEQKLQKDIQALQEKYQKGLITTRDAQSKEQELQKRAETLQTQLQKEIPALQEEERVFNNRINDLVMRAVQEINAGKKFKMVVNITSLLDADESLNITDAVLAKVNELYAKEKNNK